MDITKAFEIIEKSRKNKKSKIQALLNAGYSLDQAVEYIALESSKNIDDTQQLELPTLENEKLVCSYKDKTAIIESVGFPRSEEELLTTCKVDKNIWRVNGQQIAKNEINGKAVYQTKLNLKKKINADETMNMIQFMRDSLEESIDLHRWDHVDTLKVDLEKNYCLELSISDLHLGKLVWGQETRGPSYDSNESMRVYKNAADDLIRKAPMDYIEKIILPIGSDMFNVDGKDEMTSNGTPQMEDSRYQNTFKKGCALLTEIISQLADKTSIHLMIVPGNHDLERSFYLGEYLHAYFRNHKNVTIDNSPTLRKYYTYGQTLLGYTHGDKEKISNLPLIMAVEAKEDWAITRFKEIHIGHMHQEIDREFNGVKVRTVPSLCPADSWMTAQGYIGNNQTAKAFLYHVEKGLEAQYYSTI